MHSKSGVKVVPGAPLLSIGVILFSSVLSTYSQAEPLTAPFTSANRNPFVEVYGLPTAADAALLSEGQSSTALILEATNNFTRAQSASEAILLDGETHRAELCIAWGLSDDVELGLTIPYLSHERGGLDSFIENWHDAFGFPDGGRPDYPSDRLNYRYSRNGLVLADVWGSEDGIGDIALQGAWQLAATPERQWALRGQLKLPTGDAGALLGSESTDIALALHVSDRGLLRDSGVVLHAAAGAMWMDEGKVLNSLREDWVAFGSATLAWRYSPALSLKMQLDAHTAFYDSGLTELGDNSIQLGLGGTLKLAPEWLLDILVVEDVAVDTAPDVVFHFKLSGPGW